MILATLAGLALAAEPVTVATIDPKHRLVEGVTTDGKTIWVSSLIDRQILQCRKACATIATLPDGLHPFALAWDNKRHWLWVAADCPPGLPFLKPCERGALIALDRRGRTRARISPPAGAFHPGDVSAAGGQVFASDSQNGAVYRLIPSGKALIALVAPGIGKSAQGSALDQSGNRLIVADYSQGVTAVELTSRKRTILMRPEGRPLRGLDGLVRCGTSYYAIYNGAPPGRLLRFQVDGERIRFETLIEGGALADPTQLAIRGGELLIIGNAGWEAATKDLGAARDPAPILAVKLAEKCER